MIFSRINEIPKKKKYTDLNPIIRIDHVLNKTNATIFLQLRLKKFLDHPGKTGDTTGLDGAQPQINPTRYQTRPIISGLTLSVNLTSLNLSPFYRSRIRVTGQEQNSNSPVSSTQLNSPTSPSESPLHSILALPPAPFSVPLDATISLRPISASGLPFVALARGASGSDSTVSPCFSSLTFWSHNFTTLSLSSEDSVENWSIFALKTSCCCFLLTFWFRSLFLAEIKFGGSLNMENEKKAELVSFLKAVPPVEFCCVYGSTLHPNNKDKSAMVDYILGVADPLQWHSENLKMNADHYASWMRLLGGAKLITEVADEVGVGVHFNPFVTWNDKLLKYGVVRMHDLIQDILNWERLYLSGRLQKPVYILADNLDIENVNSVNLRAALSAALLLLPSNFTQEDLYAKICSLSYMGDLRMLFAEDKNKVKKIVQGQFDLFQSMYKPFLQEYETKDMLRFSSTENLQANITQDCELLVTRSLVSSLPPGIRSQMGMKLGQNRIMNKSGRVVNEVIVRSREEAAKCMQTILRRKVMVSSARQAISGFVAVGVVNGARYLAKKMQKAWKSWK